MAIKKLSGSGTFKLTSRGKREVAKSMYYKGRSFIAAALLLRREGDHEFVVLHLLLQGIEIVLKSLLLCRNYDKYIILIKKSIGHNLEAAVDAVIAEFNRKGLSQELRSELKTLNNLYKRQFLRYGNVFDLFVNRETVHYDKVLTKVNRLIRMVDRYIVW